MSDDSFKEFAKSAKPHQECDVISSHPSAQGAARYAAQRQALLDEHGGRPFAPLFHSDCENITRLHRCAVYADRNALAEVSAEAAAAYADQIRDAIRLLNAALYKYDRTAAGGAQ